MIFCSLRPSERTTFHHFMALLLHICPCIIWPLQTLTYSVGQAGRRHAFMCSVD
ncbi:hypothetical protein NEIELOOT_01512 [Neisseria elongata subsp. glycolytica ATCC 29315]|uniref:Uncharacterized protein n=1 Tax=Neisseria elongata subsp. glycolytica ATCC 29315 TaxID=546263 RepID=D4DR19_NEIEG|nr:hypothetical protein NEIELOOT_01512 [Neisseria elongata subsp. glycolytica ATCC 29315]